jgi:AcrR family transcriptional regulator
MDRAREQAERLPEPPWWAPEPRPTRRAATLSRERILDAAMAVLDREGLDGLSMRRVAEELGAGPASLYWHVASKELLLDLVVDRVLAEIPLPPPDPARWEAQVRAFAHDVRATLLRHGDVARASLGRVPIGPSLLRIMEWQMALLRGAGIPAAPAAWFGDQLALYLTAHAVEASMPAQDVGESLRRYLETVPPERLPATFAAVPELAGGDADERFAFGLDLLIRGLQGFTPAAPEGG